MARWNERGRKDVLLLHDLGEHLGYYEELGTFLAANGWRVTAAELRGHGKSGGQKGHVNRWRRYLEDLQAIIGTIGRPLAIVGHGMGGLVALWSLRHPLSPSIKCLLTTNPLLGLFHPPPVLTRKFGQLVSSLYPSLRIANQMKAIHLCRDDEFRQRYNQDDLIGRTITVRWSTEMLQAVQEVHQHAPQYTTPLHLILSGKGQLCAVERARSFATEYGHPVDVTVHESCFHSVFQEPERREIFEQTTRWLDSHFEGDLP